MERPSETRPEQPPRRHAPLALAFGLFAIGTRVAAVAAPMLVGAGLDYEGFACLMDPLGTIAALAGVVHAALAGANGQWGFAWATAWLLNVLAALIHVYPCIVVQPFFVAV